MDQTILEHFRKDPIRNLSIIGFFEENEPLKVFHEGETYVLTGKSDEEWTYISSSSPEELEKLLTIHGLPSKYFASLEDWMLPVIVKNYKPDWVFSSYRYFLPDNISVTNPEINTISLNGEWANYLFAHYLYKKYSSRDYIRERLEKGISAGIMINKQLVSWGLTHDDNSIGMIHTLDNFRRKGYAEVVLRSLIQKKRELKRTVFLNTEPENVNPQYLVKKLGFQFDRITHWLKLKEKNTSN